MVLGVSMPNQVIPMMARLVLGQEMPLLCNLQLKRHKLEQQKLK